MFRVARQPRRRELKKFLADTFFAISASLQTSLNSSHSLLPHFFFPFPPCFLYSSLVKSKVDDIQRLANANVWQQQESSQNDTLTQVRPLTRPPLPVSAAEKKKRLLPLQSALTPSGAASTSRQAAGGGLRFCRAAATSRTSASRSAPLSKNSKGWITAARPSLCFAFSQWSGGGRASSVFLSFCLLDTLHRHLNKDACKCFCFFGFFSSGFVARFEAPPLHSALARCSPAAGSASGKDARGKGEESGGVQATDTHTCTRTGLQQSS